MRRIKLLFLLSGLGLSSCGTTEGEQTAVPTGSPTGEAPQVIEQDSGADRTIDGQRTDGSGTEGIRRLTIAFKEKNIDKISDLIKYPLYREYPIPPIRDRAALKARFSEVFDARLVNKIATAQPGQWSGMGWRGIMLDNGLVWMDDAAEMITAVNYQSDFEKKWKKELIDREKERLHPDLSTFESPAYKIKTKSHLIRIDELSNGMYRYASWKTKGGAASESERPDIVLNNGVLNYEGSGGNHTITFKRDNYTYEVSRNIIGEENTPDILVTVEREGRTILKEDGALIFE